MSPIYEFAYSQQICYSLISRIVMIYFLYGPDTYRSRAKLREIIDAHQKKSGSSFGFTHLDAEEDDLWEKLPPHSATLFRQKTLITIENALAAKKDYTELIEARSRVWKDDALTIVIFWEREISEKRKAIAGFLKKNSAKTQEFMAPDRVALRRLVAGEAKERGIVLGRDAIEALAASGDSWTAVRELEKYALTNIHKSITNHTNTENGIREIRGLFVPISGVAGQLIKPYHLTDAVIEGRRDALRIWYAIKKTAAVEDVMLLGAFVSAVRGMLFLKSAKDAGERARIAKEEGMHNFIARKLAAQSGRFSLDELKKIYQRLLDADILAKTGSLPASSIVMRIIETRLNFDINPPHPFF